MRRVFAAASRKWLGPVAYFLFVLVFFFVIFTVAFPALPRFEIPPCLIFGGPARHYFKPNCSGKSPRSGIEYKVNEDGFRERPRSFFREKSPLFLLGDSFVEGWQVSFPDTLSQRLEYELRETKILVVNGGMRSTGPIFQWPRLRLSLNYKPRALIWVLTENDHRDDRLSVALATKWNDSGVPIGFSNEDYDSIKWLETWKRFGFLEGLFLHLQQLFYAKSQERILERGLDRSFDPCLGIKKGIQLLEKNGIKRYFVLVPLGPNNRSPDMSAEFQKTADCIEGKVLDLRKTLMERPDLFLPNDTHLNPAGNVFLAERILEAFPEIKRGKSL